MAKNKTADENAETAEGATAEPKKGRAVYLPDGTKRVDYIRRRYYEEGATRSVIAKELTELQGKAVAYQIVFAATKEKREGDETAVVAPADSMTADTEAA